jgi:hypothetical protein
MESILEISCKIGKETRAVEKWKSTIPQNSNSRSWYNRRQGETVLSEEERDCRLRSNTDFRAAESNKFLDTLLKSLPD